MYTYAMLTSVLSCVCTYSHPSVVGLLLCWNCTAISQKSQNVYEDFKLLKTSKGSTGANGAQYYIAEFKYGICNKDGYNLYRCVFCRCIVRV